MLDNCIYKFSILKKKCDIIACCTTEIAWVDKSSLSNEYWQVLVITLIGNKVSGLDNDLNANNNNNWNNILDGHVNIALTIPWSVYRD